MFVSTLPFLSKNFCNFNYLTHFPHLFPFIFRFYFDSGTLIIFVKERVLDNSGIEEVGRSRIRLFLPGDRMPDLRPGGEFQFFNQFKFQTKCCIIDWVKVGGHTAWAG